LIDKSRGWQKSAIAVAVILSLWVSNAQALKLGRITVQSALGEPLRAEIDILDINAEEAASLKTGAASPEAFRAAGLQYNPAMADLKAQLQRRPDGRAFIRLSSDTAVSAPFVDMLVETTWASGRILRDYTLLIDPPRLQKPMPAPPTPAQVPAQPEPPKVVISEPAPVPAPVATEIAPPAPRPSEIKTPPQEQARVQDKRLIVKSGDTASALAVARKPTNVSLDQMLVALLRANPNAFIDNNVNRVKAGAMITMPTAAQAMTSSPSEATDIIVAQSNDFNDFRRKLASNSPRTPVAAPDRKTSGTVQTKVDDKKPVATTPDKLTLSKGSVQEASAEVKIAKELSAKESADRATEIAKNISELSKLGIATSGVAPAPSQAISTPAKPGLIVTGEASATAPLAAASADKSRPAAPAAKPPASGWVDGLINKPYAPLGALGLIAALIGFGTYRLRKRKNDEPASSSFLKNHVQASETLDVMRETSHTVPQEAEGAVDIVHDLTLVLPLKDEPAVDRDAPVETGKEATPIAPFKVPVITSLTDALRIDLPDLNIFDSEVSTPASEQPVIKSLSEVPDLILPDLSLDAVPQADHDDPMSIKLALAQEFSAIGDEQGARALIEEVIAQASGDMKARAQLALSQLQPN
jgi:pilus assembly protein FimV